MKTFITLLPALALAPAAYAGVAQRAPGPNNGNGGIGVGAMVCSTSMVAGKSKAHFVAPTSTTTKVVSTFMSTIHTTTTPMVYFTPKVSSITITNRPVKWTTMTLPPSTITDVTTTTSRYTKTSIITGTPTTVTSTHSAAASTITLDPVTSTVDAEPDFTPAASALVSVTETTASSSPSSSSTDDSYGGSAATTTDDSYGSAATTTDDSYGSAATTTDDSYGSAATDTSASDNFPDNGYKKRELEKRQYVAGVHCTVSSISTKYTTVTATHHTVTSTVPASTHTATVTSASLKTSYTQSTHHTLKTIVATSLIPVFQTRHFATTTTITVVPTVTATPDPILYYEACGSDNLLNYTLSSGNGTATAGIAAFAFSGTTSASWNADDAYSCCVLCITAADCAGAYYKDGSCSLQTATSCDDQDDVFGTFYASGTNSIAAGDGYTISNGDCGVWSYGGTA